MPKFFEIRAVTSLREHPGTVECSEVEVEANSPECREALVKNVTRIVKSIVMQVNTTDLELTAMRTNQYYHQVSTLILPWDFRKHRISFRFGNFRQTSNRDEHASRYGCFTACD